MVSTQAARSDPAGSRPLVGRDRVLEHLLSLLERGDDRPPMILLTGEAGVGKTRLLEVLADAARPTATVLRGEVGAHVSHLPYGPVAVALDAFFAGRGESERRELVRRHPPLARLVPSLALDPPPPEPAGVDPLDLLLAAIRAIHQLSGTRPLLFVFDDLHEADPLSFDVLRYLAHLARQRRWLIVGAIREEELHAEGAVAHRLESMRREHLCAKIDLPCLSRTEAHDLVRALWDGTPVRDRFAGEICARAGGNPLFIEALVDDARQRGGAYLAGTCQGVPPQSGSPVPPRVRFLVGTQLRALNDVARRILALAAAAGEAEIPLEDLLGASATLESPILPAAVFDALDQALSTRILDERPGGYAFRHPLVRSVLCQELPRHRREELQAAWRRREGDSTRRLRLTASR
ncbi:MAG: AAA family ATPase [Solirubrobacterales bacterium]|nr:AAA family ATPase [Solirubrobacterales bacterium]